MPPVTLYYVHDPMCSWCWGFNQSLQELLKGLPPEVPVTRLLGGLAADSSEPMPDDTRDYVIKNWQRIEQAIPGVRFNFDFWEKCAPRRSTYPACRAVIAARQQDPAAETAMIAAIQSAYYEKAQNPSDDDTLTALADSIGLDKKSFLDALHSSPVHHELLDEIQQSRALGVNSFPSLVLQTTKELHHLSIDYTNPQKMLKTIKRLI